MEKSLLSQNLVYLRKKHFLNQAVLGNELGVSQNSISLIERGSSDPAVSYAASIANFFKVSLDDLVLRDLEQLDKNPLKTPAMDDPGELDQATIDLYERMLSVKDETIDTLKETIEVLKHNLETYRKLSNK